MSTSGIISVPVTRTPFQGTQTSTQDGNGYYINVGLPGGQVHNVLIDTGSCGLVIPVALLHQGGNIANPFLDGVRQLEQITIPYQPSSEDLSGYVYHVDAIDIGVSLDGTAPAFTAKNVKIVGVTDAKKAGFGMMGVGFGRPNPFADNLLLSAPAPVNPSYLFTPQGITVGYTQETLASAGLGTFNFQSLARSQALDLPSDWQTPFAKVTLGTTPFQGTALLDTGINSMMVAFPESGWEKTLIGEQITVAWSIPDAIAPILSYSFTVGQAQQPSVLTDSRPTYGVVGTSPARPSELIPVGNPPPAVFVNTGINVIQLASYFYDAQAGLIGFCVNKN